MRFSSTYEAAVSQQLDALIGGQVFARGIMKGEIGRSNIEMCVDVVVQGWSEPVVASEWRAPLRVVSPTNREILDRAVASAMRPVQRRVCREGRVHMITSGVDGAARAAEQQVAEK